MSEIETLAATVSALAAPGVKPKELVAAVREKHPKASKKEVVHAAFYALTDGTSYDAEKGKNLYTFAMSERAYAEALDDQPRKVKRPRKDKRTS